MKTVSSSGSAGTVYLPGLNGLRAIAAIAVLIAHITIRLNEFGLDNRIFGTDADGNGTGPSIAGHGVTIFFTLSGFLITFLLLKEKEQTGQVRTRDFYIRRILRIWPLYYLYFFICLAVIFICGLPYVKSSVPFYIFLAANIPYILGNALPLLDHYWSLGVEEQFYLFFPQLAKLSNKKLLRTAMVLIFILLFIKFIFWILYRKNGIEIPFLAIGVTRFHTMLIGVVGAILYYHKNEKFIFLSTNWITQCIAWLCIFLTAINRFHIASVIDGELISLVSLCLIMGQVTRKNRLINLENKACDFIGKISFGIYVIHPLLIFCCYRIVGHLADKAINYFIVYLLVTGATILLASVSYELYEKRFLKLKGKYTTIKSSNTKSNL